MADTTHKEPTQAPLVDIVLPLETSEQPDAWKSAIAATLELEPAKIVEMRLRKHSIDARQKQIKVQLRIEVGIGAPLPAEPKLQANYTAASPSAKTVIIIGCGPAGMFAALRGL